MADLYGSDISTFAGPGNSIGIDPLLRPITGPRVVLEAVARRLLTPRGALPRGPSDYGFDLVAALMGRRLSPVDRKRLEADIRAEALKDTRVLSVPVCRLSEAGKDRFELELSIDLAEGPFPLVLGISQVTVQLLRAE